MMVKKIQLFTGTRMTSERVHWKNYKRRRITVGGMNFISYHPLNLDIPQYFALQISTGYTGVMTNTSSAYESMFIITSCARQVFMTLNRHGSLHHRRYRVTTCHYCQRPEGLMLADIYRKAETHTPWIFPTKPIIENISIPQESF